MRALTMGWLQHKWVQRHYELGYVMTKAIAQRDRDAEIGRLIAGPGEAFVRRYVALTQEPGSPCRNSARA